jgi:hypothetical protein
MTLTIIKTTKDYVFGAFTTAEWESSWDGIKKVGPKSFIFSLYDKRKYCLASEDQTAIGCYTKWAACFGNGDLSISGNSNTDSESYCNANRDSYKLPNAWFKTHPSLNGGEYNFTSKEFEVYQVMVRK